MNVPHNKKLAKVKVRNFKTASTDYSYFKDVAKFQIRLTVEEEEALFNSYTELEKEFKLTLLQTREAQTNLITVVKDIKDKGKSIAKLHCKFDNNKSGHNQKIIEEMNKKFSLIDTDSLTETRASRLYDIGFSKEVYDLIYNISIEIIPEDIQEKLFELKERIKEIESKLTCSALMMAVSIAQRYTSNVFNIDIKDAIQEATIGVYESVNLYDPTYRTKNGNRVKFSTYANIKAEKRVKEKIMETSRLIRLPKSRLDVLFTVLRACTNLEELNVELITQKANELLEKRKNRKLKPAEILSEKKITEAITLLNNNCIMLDSPINTFGDETGDIKTFSDVIPDPQASAEDNIIAKDSKKELVELMKEYLDNISYNVVCLRYIEDPPKSHEETAEFLYGRGITKKKLSKEAIRQKENYALQRLMLKDSKGILKDLLLESIAAKNRLEE